MSSIRIVRDYPYPPQKVWLALTDPELCKLWMVKAQPEGFSTTVGSTFQFVGKPMFGWNGIVNCKVLEALEPSVFRYSWLVEGDDLMECSYRLEPQGTGTRFTFDQTGFTGIGGFLIAKLIMTPVRKKMFGANMLAVLQNTDDQGKLIPGSTLNPPVL